MSAELHRACTDIVMLAAATVLVAAMYVLVTVGPLWLMARIGSRRQRRAAGKSWQQHAREWEACRQEAETGRRLYPVPDLEKRAVRYAKKRVPLTLVGESGTRDHLINGGSDGHAA